MVLFKDEKESAVVTVLNILCVVWMEETTLWAKLNFWKALAALLKLTYVLPWTISCNMVYHGGMISIEVLTALLI